MNRLILTLLLLILVLSGCSRKYSNVKYTDLGESHEYTEFDKNNKMIYSEEMSHNYNDEKICVNCGHSANENNSNNPYSCNEDASTSDYPIFRIKHDTQDIWSCSDLDNPFIKGQPKAFRFVSYINPDNSDQKCFALFESEGKEYFAMVSYTSNIPSDDISIEYIVVDKETYFNLGGWNENSLFIIHEDLLNYNWSWN